MTVELLSALARSNLAAGAAVILVFLLRRPVRRLAGVRAAYALWTLPVAAGLAALLPHPQTPALLAPVAEITAAVFEAVPAPAAPGLDWPALLVGTWLGGVVAAVLLMAVRQVRFMAALGRVGPAVVGAIRPRIVTPDDFEARFDAAEREVILAHEAVHLQAQDARINALAAALQCLCWFNPLIHLGVRVMRIDQELACDAAVLARFPAARRLYGELLLRTQLAAQPLPLGCHWPAGAEHPLKERIAMLKSPLPSPARRAAGLAGVALAALATAAAAWAAQPPSTKDAVAPASSAAGDAPADANPVVDAPHAQATAPPVATPGPRKMAVAAPRPAPTPAPAEKIQLAVQSAPAPQPRPLVTKPDWIKRPTPADVAQWYPEEAKRTGLAGDAVIDCEVAATGLLEKCQVAREAPEGAGFGQAALAMSGSFQMKPASKDGVAVAGGKVRIPFRFALPATPPSAPN